MSTQVAIINLSPAGKAVFKQKIIKAGMELNKNGHCYLGYHLPPQENETASLFFCTAMSSAIEYSNEILNKYHAPEQAAVLATDGGSMAYDKLIESLYGFPGVLIDPTKLPNQ